MKRLALSLMVALLVTNLPAQQIYKKVDSQGNVSYSDQQSEGSEEIVPEINVQSFPAAPAAEPQSSTNRSAIPNYRLVRIVSPAHDTTLRNISSMSVTASVTPRLRNNHRLLFLDNGLPLADAGRSMSTAINYPDRGTHSLQAQIVDEKGQVIITSKPVDVHVHKTSVAN